MKKLILLLSFLTPFWSFAQSATILPNAVAIPKVGTLATCNTTEKGKQIFNNTDNKMYFCNGTSWQEMTGGGFTLPYVGTASSANPILSIENTGGGRGIFAKTENSAAIRGQSEESYGVVGVSTTGYGVTGLSTSSYAGHFESFGTTPTLYVYSSTDNAAYLDGNVKISQDLIVDDNKGIVRSNSATQQKVVRISGPFSLNARPVGAHLDASLGFESFGGIPTVIVGQVSNGTGDWHKITLVPFNVTNNSCQIRFVNLSDTAVTMSGTWHFLIVGPK